MIQHVARGMFGAIIVDPKNAKAWAKADREYVLIESEFFKNPDDVQGMFDHKFDGVMFNSGIFKYHPFVASGGKLDAKPGDWSGIYASAGAFVGFDHVVLASAGGISRIEGTFKAFSPIELQQADGRIANSVLGDVRAEAPSHLPRRWQAKARTAYKAGVDNDRAYIKIGPARTGAGQIARIFEIGSARNRGYIRHPLWPKPDTPRASWKWADGRQPINPALPAIFARLQEDPALRWSHSEEILIAAEETVRRAEAARLAGLDLADVDFDREQGLHSLPAAIGVRQAIQVARGLHAATVGLLAIVVSEAVGGSAAGWISYAGVVAVAALLTYEHTLVSEEDLRKLDAAFFTMNGVISIVFFTFILVDRFI